MVQYRADGEGEIKELFDREGDYLARAGFTEPDLSSGPEGYQQSTTTPPLPGNEWEASGNPIMYSEMNAKAVRVWREQETAGEIGTTALFKTIE